MAYSSEQRKRAVFLRDELFKDHGGGIYNGKSWNFVLNNRVLNLWDGIRNQAIEYFFKNNKEWHKDINDEPKEGPEGHLLSSNIACINHLFFLRDKPDFATLVLKNIDSRIENSEIIDDGYIEFEKMGGKNDNPLNEKSKQRKGGSKSTSIDALMVGKKCDGNNILALIEWKYTEKYENQKCKFIAKDGYHQNYLDFLQDKNCPINAPENVMELFFEPYYQLMRQTLLGWKMIEFSEYNCNEYVHLHIVPRGNNELINNCMDWIKYLKDPKKYKIISPDELLKPLIREKEPQILFEYLEKRYW
jgi:hypothetical protein